MGARDDIRTVCGGNNSRPAARRPVSEMERADSMILQPFLALKSVGVNQ
jgi:hypothetical protein